MTERGSPCIRPTGESNGGRLLGELLRRIDEAVTVPLSVDVFGLTAFNVDRYESLGQHLEEWTAYVEIFSPMLYLNAMRHWGLRLPNRSYALVYQGVSQLRERLGPRAVIRPYLQSFARGSDGFHPQFIADQVRAARDGGADGFLFWHPGGDYQMLFQGLQGPARHLIPFPVEERMAIRRLPARPVRTPPADS